MIGHAGTNFFLPIKSVLDELAVAYHVTEEGVLEVAGRAGTCTVSLAGPTLDDVELSSELYVEVCYPLPENVSATVARLGGAANVFATLGVLTEHAFVARAPLASVPWHVLAPVAASSAAFGPFGTLAGLYGSLKGDPPADRIPSAWSGDEIDLLIYRLAHLGTVHRAADGLSLTGFNERWGHITTLSPIDNHPVFAGGLLAVTTCFRDDEWGDTLAETAQALNATSCTHGESPVFGSWCERDGNLAYATFIPNLLHDVPDMAWHTLNWQLAQTGWAMSLVSAG
jgi:hypothetical protein